MKGKSQAFELVLVQSIKLSQHLHREVRLLGRSILGVRKWIYDRAAGNSHKCKELSII